MSISALSSSAPLSKPNKYKYNGFEEQTDFDPMVASGTVEHLMKKGKWYDNPFKEKKKIRSPKAKRAYKLAYNKKFLRANKLNGVLGVAGKWLGISSIVTGIVDVYNDPSLTNITKLAIGVGSLALKSNPIGLAISTGLAIADYTGVTDDVLKTVFNEHEK